MFASCTFEIVPNVLVELMFVAGFARFTWLKRLAYWASKRRFARSVKGKFLPSVPAKVTVPGPTSVPTGQLPKRPMLFWFPAAS